MVSFRPILSDIGPTNRLPNPKPIINKDKVSCAFAVVVLKSFFNSGSPGKNISIDKAPIAVKAPNIIINNGEFFFVFALYPLYYPTFLGFIFLCID